MKKFLFVATLFVATFILSYLFMQDKKDTQKSQSISTNDELISPKEMPKIEGISILKAPNIQKKIELKDMKTQHQTKHLVDTFLVMDKDKSTSNLPSQKDITPLIAIKVKHGSISSLKNGDSFDLPPIDNNSYVVNVEQKIQNKSGSVSIYGTVKTSQGEFKATFTESKNSLFGTFSTPSGSYEMEVYGDNGYIYNQEEMKKREDYSKKDTLIPPFSTSN